MAKSKYILKKLESLGFSIKYCDGSLIKLIPPEKNKPMYSAHISEEKMLFPLNRFSKRNWGIDIFSL